MPRKSFRQRRRRATRYNRRMTMILQYLNEIEGIKPILLSTLTQKFVECDIGYKVSSANPWIYVDKEKIDTHLEFYDTESCFYPIKDAIEAFPKNEILVGSYVCASNTPAVFFVCTTLSAEEMILDAMEQQRIRIQRQIMNMQIKAPLGVWVSLGSEIEVVSEMNLNNRNLFVVNIHGIQLVKQRRKFDMCFTEDLLNGYTELLPGRNTYNLVMKKRLNRGVQCGSSHEHKGVQSSSVDHATRSVQYCYEYSEIKITGILAQHLSDFLKSLYEDFSQLLAENREFIMEANDYSCLPSLTQNILVPPEEIKLYQEIMFCMGKKISSLTWNAMTSGIVATAYVKNPLFQISKEPPTTSIFSSAPEEICTALIWEYKNNLTPKFYLHGRGEISALSFCPYNKNILVAGFSNGQVAIWDLKESFEAKEDKIFLTLREQHNRLEILEFSSWIKKPLGPEHIFPTITSKLEVSHSAPVTSISWIPPDSFIASGETKYYKIRFVTSDLNGNVICVWEVDPTKEVMELHHHSKSRIKDKPEALTCGVSKLKKYEASFAPSYKFYISCLINPSNYPMLKVLSFNEFYSYKARNPKTLKDLNADTNFRVTGLVHPFNSNLNILFTTAFGVVQATSSVGPSAGTGQNVEICNVETLPVVHDGPILVCEANAFFPNIMLTVGGSIFAIWDWKLRLVLLWRKSFQRYLSGMWCFHRPLSLILFRNDRRFEYWNVCEQSKAPLTLFKYKGYDPLNFYGNTTNFYIRKNTFITTDSLGAFKILLLPTETQEQNKSNISEAVTFLERTMNCIKYIELFKERQSKIQDVAEVQVVEKVLESKDTNEKVPELETQKVKPSRAEVFQKDLIKHGISVLLDLKGQNLKEQIRMVENLQVGFKTSKHLDQKRIESADHVQFTRNRVFAKFRTLSSRRSQLKLNISKELAEDLKRQFFNDYNNIEVDIKLQLETGENAPQLDSTELRDIVFRVKYVKKFLQKLRFKSEDLSKHVGFDKIDLTTASVNTAFEKIIETESEFNVTESGDVVDSFRI